MNKIQRKLLLEQEETQALFYNNGEVVGQVKQLVELVEQVRQLELQRRQVKVDVRYCPETQVKQFVESGPEQLMQVALHNPQV